jgi:hypothetical protein
VIESLPVLDTLNLSSNQISDVDYHTFNTFRSSLTIYLDGCLFPLELIQEIMNYVNCVDYQGSKIYLSVHDNQNNNDTVDIDTSLSQLTSSLKEIVGTGEMDEIDHERARAMHEAYNCIVLENARREPLTPNSKHTRTTINHTIG